MNSPKIAIVDYQLGNLFSVCMACEKLGHPAVLASSSEQLEQADAIILPGVGAFGKAMENLERLDMLSPLKDHISAGKPLFGICLGHQLLGRVFGGKTFKLKFGHRGANHPVRELASGRVHITA